jgi:hypothetical protein
MNILKQILQALGIPHDALLVLGIIFIALGFAELFQVRRKSEKLFWMIMYDLDEKTSETLSEHS